MGGKSKKLAFAKNQKKWTENKASQEAAINKIKKYCQVVRLIAHTQMKLLPLKQKKAHIIELQVNGGSSADKVDFAKGLFEQQISVSQGRQHRLHRCHPGSRTKGCNQPMGHQEAPP